jgi:hypothetical protein
MRAVAALSNVELITALLSCNRQLALVGLQLRIINGVVSLLTTEVHNRALAAYLSEQARANANSGRRALRASRYGDRPPFRR